MAATSPPAPRTLLEALVQQRRWTQQQFCDAYAETARRMDLNLTVSHQHAGRWLGGKLKGLPYPTQCRVLERLFNVEITALLGPPGPNAGPGLAPSRTSGRLDAQDTNEELSMAADEAARFAQFAEQTNVGPHTLEQFAADIRRIVTVYPNRPVYPLFVELRSLRNRAFQILEGRQPPDRTREVYLVAGTLTGVLANASFDLGRLDAAETQARTAFLCAELAGSNWLRAWIRGTQALVAYWDNRPLAAIRLAEDGERFTPESGTAAVRLASIAARAHGMMRDRHGVVAALGRAQDARSAVTADDDPGGMMAFPLAKQSYSAATARLWLGEQDSARQAQRDAELATRLYEQDPPQTRRLGEWNLARLDQATAHLALDDVEGALLDIRPVLAAGKARPIASVSRRLGQFDAVLARPRYRGNQVTTDLRDEIRAALGADRPALPARPGP